MEEEKRVNEKERWNDGGERQRKEGTPFPPSNKGIRFILKIVQTSTSGLMGNSIRHEFKRLPK